MVTAWMIPGRRAMGESAYTAWRSGPAHPSEQRSTKRAGVGMVMPDAFIPVAEVTAIGFLQPIIGVVAGAIVLREVVGVRRGVAIAAGFVGAIIVIRPGIDSMNVGIMLALAGFIAIVILLLPRSCLPPGRPTC